MKRLSCLVLLIASVNCSPESTDQQPNDGTTPEQGKTPASSTSQSNPIATLELPNGNLVKFYDTEDGTLITEEAGVANALPMFTFPKGSDQLVSSWQTAAPDVAVPQVLRDLESRLSPGGSPQPVQPEPVTKPPVAPTVPTDAEPLVASGSCGNVCCDQTWLQANLGECRPGGGSYSWELFNYGYSYVHQPSYIVSWADGVLCSAQGTSTWSAAWKNGGGFTTGVQEGYWLRHQFTAAYSCNPFCGYSNTWFNYDVNSVSNQHLHSFCGDLFYNL